MDAYRNTVVAISEGRAITPASEWLVDNYHLVERYIREIHSDLPPGYYRQLPKLTDGPFGGYPRMFGLAWAFVAHTDSRFDSHMLLRYLQAYQTVQPLSIGELWAASVTLRIVLIENLRRLAEYIVQHRRERAEADKLADRLLGVNGQTPEPVEDVLSAHNDGLLADAFAVQLVHRLRDQDPRITPALDWLDRRLAAQYSSPDAVVREVHRRQGASNVSVRNVITSLRLISDVDWRDLFEASSLVDGILAEGSTFREMDFATRNLYRSAIEQIARGSGLTEIEVAQRAMRSVSTAQRKADTILDERLSDPGYFLLAAGRAAFEQDIGYRPSIRARLARLNDAVGIRGYAAGVILVTALLLIIPIVVLPHFGLGVLPLMALVALGAIPAVDAAVALVNRAVSIGFLAARLPALALRNGIPDDLRTVVAVPTLLTSAASIAEQVERLEIHYLASPDNNLHFALLSDWKDSSSDTDEGDAALLHAAASGINGLNERYGPATSGPRFLLLHRRRMWAKSEDRWIGWERKRGKLHELNRWLRGADDTSFISIDGVKPVPPPDIRYVVTLDADTRLPRDTVLKLVGKMAHPLNRPRFDASAARVTEGYAILQPRVTPSLPMGEEGSLFQRIFSSVSGIDPYASAVSDVYQDMFGEGSYAGKGIYDVDAFEVALAGRVPQSTLLSHDLFEGIFARAGLASDVEVVEDYPSRYDVGALRHHRWARGDWQLLPWVLGSVPSSEGADPAFNAIPPVGRWKMIDNLRRTLTAPLAIIALIAGWMMPFQAALIWTIFILTTIALPSIIPVVAAIPPRRSGVTMASHARALGGDFRLSLSLSGLVVTFLAHQAWLMGDAIISTLYRLFISRRNMLEWIPAAQAGAGRSLDLAEFYRVMAGAPIIAVLAVGLSVIAGQGSWPLAMLFALLWCASPAVALQVSLSPKRAGQVHVGSDDAQALRLTARRTWRFFESFVTPDDNMLPPDNFQEVPAPILAHRTSPTNIGLYLLSVVSARDFGWIGKREAVDRLEATFTTMKALEHFRGHLFNWYDTRDLRPLDPRYVSTVDSGNLAGHLIALANACSEWRRTPGAEDQCLAGIVDVIDLARDEAARLRDGPRTQTATWEQLDAALLMLASDSGRDLNTDESISTRLAALAAQADTAADIAFAIASERGTGSCIDMLYWVQSIASTIDAHRNDALHDAEARLIALEIESRAMALDMDFAFLLDKDRMLLSIGYLMHEGKLDENCYDLLASEARLASFFAIAKGNIPARHWFRLGRSVTPVAHAAALVSWSGSMFEYLMPSLVMRAPAGSLLEQTSRLIVRRQIDYGASLELPWGISESAYNARDLEFTYQYSNFGIPGLGLKRGLSENSVIAPYATALAAMVDPAAATANLKRIESEGGLGRHGFYEALDYTPSRVPEDRSVAVVKAFMAHHQGMTIVAIADTLFGGRMRARFHAEPIMQATELLLQERMPRDVSVAKPWASEVKTGARSRDIEPLGGRRFSSAGQAAPPTLLLSNGYYTTMLTTAGSGYSSWGDIGVTRWREDATLDDYGSYVFLRDVNSGAVWSAGFQPSGIEPDDYRVNFNEDRAEFTRQDGTLTTTLDILVSPEDDAEVRRVSITNSGNRMRIIDVTSYAELALAAPADDMAHPAFSKLFIETEYLSDVGLILATRRKRAAGEAELWAGHLAVVDGDIVGKPQIETDRARFLGRGHGVRSPISVMDGRVLSNTVGTVLDPVFALRHRVRVAPGATVRVVYWTMAASSRQALLDCADKHRDTTAFNRAATLAWTQAQVQLHHLGITAGEAALFQRLAGYLIYAAPALRPSSDAITRGVGAQSGLWLQGISGDLPIVLLRISDTENLDIARELLQAHEYWRMKGLPADLVILNERQSSYVQDFHIALETLVRTMTTRPDPATGRKVQGRVFVLRADLIPAEARALLSSVARIVLVAQRGNLFDQLDRLSEAVKTPKTIARALPVSAAPQPPLAVPHLEFFNGLGGFADDGKQYVTVLGPGQSTPVPWINVISNPAFGFQVAADGGGYTWSVNSRENQLTPWSNDPVTNHPGEAFYLRDDDTSAVWSPTAHPIRDDKASYMARHGRGFSRFEHIAHGVVSDLVQYVPLDAPVKISRLKLHNNSNRTRHVSVTAYVEWVLGRARSGSLAFVTTSIDPATGAMLARNPWNRDFGSRVAFADFRGAQTDWTGNRKEFIGRNGSLSSPAALGSNAPFSKTTGAGLDPCGALRTRLEIAPNASVEVVFLLGEADHAEEARTIICRYRSIDLDAVLKEVEAHWGAMLDSVTVKTPDRAMDIMLNGWLMYQTIACRVWARSGFYQSSGAYGFRDQLQDGMALAAIEPAMTRSHLLRAAARQFVEGDVQHWWLPHSGQGVRTRISDDRAWLAYTVAHYVEVSGDAAVLDEVVPFLEGQQLEPHEHDNFFLPNISDETATLFEHCARALDQSLIVGRHGLPLIGTGDWNDGMNRVGEKGEGESVWLGWFLHAALAAFVPVAEARGDLDRTARWREHMATLEIALAEEAWDGEWYRRGFYDDGTALGSSLSDECKIDSIAQSWSVLSGAADGARTRMAMEALERSLIKPDDGLALLFAPPFDKTSHNPGYIKGYPPGIRENGGQYTHAATWSVMALAKLGEGNKAFDLFAMLNPINHARTRSEVHRYKVEPYVVAADIYARAPHVGRGGWTWYTGSAGWLQRAGIEAILGLRIKGNSLHLNPCIPRHWPSFDMTLRYRSATYAIRIENPEGVCSGIACSTLDGVPILTPPNQMPLIDDGLAHVVVVRLG
ncbi:GH36-type glycosyl hydrolase domain-containing protein [Aestuariivirga sp.]|uniref:GH36-type glycosyl hydrolase domain-containing protein n=1 Tax=Aestuariivirga sp. TaxID=2650926 RepID=UPI003593C996